MGKSKSQYTRDLMHKEDEEGEKEKKQNPKEKNLCRDKISYLPTLSGAQTADRTLVLIPIYPQCARGPRKKNGDMKSQGANIRAYKMILTRLDSILDRSETSCRTPWHWASNCGFGLEFPEWDRHRKVDLFNSKTMICMN